MPNRSRANQAEHETVRLDRWLWAARFYKTRQLSAAALKAGKVEHNGQRAKPARTVRIGDTLVVRREQFVHEITVRELRERRVGAELARTMYEESAQSIEQRRLLAEQLDADRRTIRYADGRPGKRDRRQLNQFKRGEHS